MKHNDIRAYSSNHAADSPTVNWLSLLVLALAVFFAGCDRPFVAVDPPQIEILHPDLAEIQLSETITVRLRASSLRRITRLEVNGLEAIPTAETGVFEIDLSLLEGENRLNVDAFDSAGDVGTSTFFALFLPYDTANILAAALPIALANHTTTRLADGRLLVAGGFDTAGSAIASAFLYLELGVDFQITDSNDELAFARAGHTATTLPDGRVLFVGGASTLDPRTANEFVAVGEVYDPMTDEFSTPTFAGEAVRRAFHSAISLTSGGRNYLYVFGGRGVVRGSEVGTRSDVTVLELRSSALGDSLVNLSPGGAVGAFPAVAQHVQLPLPADGGNQRSLAAGTYVDPDGADVSPVAFRFLYTPSTFFFPFEVNEDPLPPMQSPRIASAAAPVFPGLIFLTGGRTPDGEVLRDLEVFADGAGAFFRFPEATALRTARYSHTATLLPSGRILLLGGVNQAGTVIASAEYVLPSTP